MSSSEWLKESDTLRQLMILAALIPPPISLDVLAEVGGYSPVTVIRLLEDLVHSKVLAHYQEGELGLYRFGDTGKAAEILVHEDRGLIREMAAALLRYFAANPPPGPKKALAIANVCHGAGLRSTDNASLLQAANYCLNHGAQQAAAIYYRMVLESGVGLAAGKQEAAGMVSSALGVLEASGHYMPLNRQEQILVKAHEQAKQINDLRSLCKINLRLGQIHKLRGDYQGAGRFFEEGWRVAILMDEPETRKEAALFSTDFLFWQGRISEAVSRYEEVIGDLEEFPNSEAELRACTTLGWCYSICGQTARGLGLLEAVRQKSRSLGFKEAEMDSCVMSMLAMIDAGYISEAEGMVNEVFKHSEEELGNYRLWASYAARGYLLLTKGKLEDCFVYQQKAYTKSKEIGWPHHRGPFNFDYMETLEEAGMVHPEMNYESELRRISRWPDIYMQGVGMRYEARRMLKQGKPKNLIVAKLEGSQALLGMAGANLELARTRLALAKLHLEDDNQEAARELLRQAWAVFSTINEDLFPYALRPYLETEAPEERILQVMTELSQAMGTVLDRENLLERVIKLLMKLTLAGRGGYFVSGPDGQPVLAASRNLEQVLVESPSFEPSLAMIKNAFQGQEQPRGGAPFNAACPSAQRGENGWSLCRRVGFQGRTLGVIYLDNAMVGITPPAKVMSFLDVVISYVAMALDNARAYEDINAFKDRLEDETKLYRKELQCSAKVGQMVGRSSAMGRVSDQIHRVAASETTVLILGETGVGKDMAARAIHGLSKHCEGPFIPVDTALLDPGVVASELFGHERGAFTGAVSTRRGRFELADRGTLFLDDIDNLAPEVQARLLRVLQEKAFHRLGGDKLIRSNFRLIAATNQDLEALVAKGLFRADLFFRLNTFPIMVPPLRQRRDDIPLLASYFLEKFASKMGKDISGIAKRDLQRLCDYNWPGNVRELKHVIERSVILSEGGLLRVGDLTGESHHDKAPEKFLSLLEMERSHILAAMSRCQWKVSGKGGAAELLGLKPTTLYSKLKKLGVNRQNRPA